MPTRQSIYKAVDEEIERARKKYPSSDTDARFMGLASEAGESLQAVVKWHLNPTPETRQAARDELIQSMGQHVRALEELGLMDPCAVCGDLGMIEEVFFHPDFGPDSAWKPVEIHWAWKLFLVIAAFYCLLMALGVM